MEAALCGGRVGGGRKDDPVMTPKMGCHTQPRQSDNWTTARTEPKPAPPTELAAEAGHTPSELLCRVLREATAHHASHLCLPCHQSLRLVDARVAHRQNSESTPMRNRCPLRAQGPGIGPCTVSNCDATMPRQTEAVYNVQTVSCTRAQPAGAEKARTGARLCLRAPPPHPYNGQRIGEATNPGPGDDTRDGTSQRRHRGLHALAQMGLRRPDTGPPSHAELCSGEPQELVVLGSEVGGRWSGEAGRFVQHLLRVRAPPALRRAAAAGWSRRWWGILAVAVQQAGLGQRRSTRARGMSRPSSECSSSPDQRAPVACRCARSGRRCGFLASSESVA